MVESWTESSRLADLAQPKIHVELENTSNLTFVAPQKLANRKQAHFYQCLTLTLHLRLNSSSFLLCLPSCFTLSPKRPTHSLIHQFIIQGPAEVPSSWWYLFSYTALSLYQIPGWIIACSHLVISIQHWVALVFICSPPPHPSLPWAPQKTAKLWRVGYTTLSSCICLS